MNAEEWDLLLYGEEEGMAAYSSEPRAAADAVEAARHMRHAAAIEASAEMVDDAFKEEISRLQSRRAEQREAFAARVAWHEESARQWHLAMVAAGRAEKTIHFPTGVARVTHRSRPMIVVNDGASLRSWLMDTDPEVEAKVYPPKPRKDSDPLKNALLELFPQPKREGGPGKLVTEDGDVLPGVTAMYPGATWSRGKAK